jgi:hypothetical protein
MENITQQQKQQMDNELKQLEQDIATGNLVITRNYKGELSVSNWNNTSSAKAGWCEGCALAQLATSGSWIIRNKLASYGIQKNKEFVVASHNDHTHKPGHNH